MKQNKVLAFFMTLLILTYIFAGCKSNDSTGDNSSAENPTATGSPSGEGTADSTIDFSKHVNADGKTFIRIGITQDPGTFDPLVGSNSTGRQFALNPIAQHLCTSNSELELLGELAKGWEQLDDYTYHIEIYDNIYDSEGNHITSADVVWCYEQSKAAGIGQTKNISSIKPIDNYNIEMVLGDSTITLFQSVMRRINIVSKAAYEASPNQMATSPVMTGPYVLTEYVPDSKIAVEKRNDYWKTDETQLVFSEAANVDIIEFYVIKETAQLAIALESGQIDMVYDLGTTEAARFMDGENAKEGYHVFTSNTSDVILLFLNCSDQSVFKDNLALRQAVLYSFDSQAIADGAYDSGATPCKAFGSSVLPDYLDEWKDPNFDYYNYNEGKAKELLTQSGYNAQEDALNIMVDTDSRRKMVAQILQNYLLAIGINAEINAYEPTLYDTYADDPTKWDIRIDAGSSSDYLASMLDGRFNAKKMGEGIYNESFANDAHLQELVLAANDPKTFSPETVKALQNYITGQAYAVGLVNLVKYTVSTDAVDDIVLSYMPNLLPAACSYVWNEEQ